MAPDPPVVLLRWEEVLGDILDRTQRFPKAVRFTFSGRIDNLGLDVLDLLVQAQYAAPLEKLDVLGDVNRALNRLRAFIRLSHRRRYLDGKGYEHVSRGVDEVGRMCGAWRKEAAGRA